jgi:glycosyltransferase involved in cell wall biosynthesis
MAVTERKIRIAIIIPRLEALGPVIVIQNLVNSLYGIGNISIKVFYLDSKTDSNVQMTVPVEKLIHGKFRFDDYDIIHTNGIRPDLLGYLNRKNIKYHISTIHNFVFDDLAFTYNRLTSLLFGRICLIIWKHADRLVCVSGAMKEYYKEWFSTAKIEVIHNGISEPGNHQVPDADVVQSIEKFRFGGFTVLGCTGILTKRKGIDQVLRLIAAEKGLAAIIIGDGKELNNLKRLSEKLDISDRCEFCGFRSNAVVYFKYLDFFIMPSRSEGFGLALIEAVQQRIPVICSDIDVFRELFTGDEVTFFKSGNQADLYSAFRVASETGKIKTLNALTRYENNYTASSMAMHYYELYESACQM